MAESNIRWTERTWSPIIACSKCSEGCLNCYALLEAIRNVKRMSVTAKSEKGLETLNAYKKALEWRNGEPVGWNGKAQLISHALQKPANQKKPVVYFVGSMSDIFHDSVPYKWLEQLFDTMVNSPQHKYILLTKRPWNIVKKLFGTRTSQTLSSSAQAKEYNSIPEIYIGISAENHKRLEERRPWLSMILATGRFISAEPLLGPVDFTTGDNLNNIDQVVTGGESGKNHRSLNWSWVRSIRDACERNSVAFFLQQNSGTVVEKMPELDGKQHTHLIWKN